MLVVFGHLFAHLLADQLRQLWNLFVALLDVLAQPLKLFLIAHEPRLHRLKSLGEGCELAADFIDSGE